MSEPLPRCPEPECPGYDSMRFVSGARFGIPGRIHSTCYSRRVHRAVRREERRTAKPRRENVARTAEPKPEPLAEERWLPKPGDLDRMPAAAAARFLLDSWGQPWLPVLLTAEPRGVDGLAISEAP